MRLRGAHEGSMLALVTTPAATPPAYWYVAALKAYARTILSCGIAYGALGLVVVLVGLVLR